MLFQVANWAESENFAPEFIPAGTLQLAIDHVESCLFAAQNLDFIANKAQIQEDAEVLFANILIRFQNKTKNGGIYLTRTEITEAFAHHSGRKGSLKPFEIYTRLIPFLIKQGKAKEIPRPGKPAAYVFKLEQ